MCAGASRLFSQTLTFTCDTSDTTKMTLENIMSQMGMGNKQLTERFSEHSGPMHDQHIYYAYEATQPSHGSLATSKHTHIHGSGLKSNASMSALTLLAFLFFLHILQQCIKDHMTDMSTPPLVVMSSRETDDELPTSVKKIDKAGFNDDANDNSDANMMKIKPIEYKKEDYEYTKTFKSYVNAMDEDD